MKRYFLTVDWCSKGNRGIFCNKNGNSFSKETEHTEDEMWEILDAFSMILNPKSEPFTEAEIKLHKRFVPLAEYSNQYGVALRRGE